MLYRIDVTKMRETLRVFQSIIPSSVRHNFNRYDNGVTAASSFPVKKYNV